MKRTLLTLAASPLPVTAAHALTDREIRQILYRNRQAVGSAWWSEESTQKGRRIVSLGSLDQNDKRPLNGDTVFEIGSIPFPSRCESTGRV